MRVLAFRRLTLRWSSRFASMTSQALFWSAALLAMLWLAASLAALAAARQEAARQADMAGANVAAALGQELERGMALIDFSLRRVAEGTRDPDLQTLNPARRNEVMFAGAAMVPNLAFFDALDANGDVSASLEPQEHATNWARSDYFIEHRRDATLDLRISRPFEATRQDLAGIAISRRMSHPDGSFAGVVVCGIRLSYVREMFERLALGPRGAITLFRADGVVLTRLPADVNTVGHVLDPADPLARAVQAGVAGMALDDPIDHVRRQFTLRRVGALPLVIAVGLAREDMQAGWLAEVIVIMAAGGLLALLTVAMALRLRLELHRREAAERENAARAHFLATMSHELRAPLHGMLGYAEQLRNAGDLPKHHVHRLDVIVNAGRMLREVVDRLLDFWRLEANGPVPQMRQIDMPGLLRECCAVVEPEARAKSLELHCVIAPAAPQQFVTDGAWLRQVVLNLLENAVKYTRHGMVELSYDGHQDRVWIEVTDTGPGISLEKRHRLFHEYDRLDADDTDVDGTGLGLSIADRLIRLMGGHIGHRDNHGGGSVFWVNLPAGAVQEPAAPIDATAAPLGHPLRILVVDDSAVHRDLAKAFLSDAGHSVVEAAAGQEAVQLADAEEFDVILMDMCMPVMSGLEASRQIRALQRRRRAVPIIAVTANALDAEVEQYRHAGLVDHLSKPFTKAELLATIGAAVQQCPRAPATPIPPLPMEAEAPLLDIAMLTELETSIGSRKMVNHLVTLTDGITALSASLRDPTASADPEELARLAHVIAGDAGELGFVGLSVAACRFLVAIEHDAGEVAAAVATLRVVAAQSQDVLRQRLESLRCDLDQSTKPS